MEKFLEVLEGRFDLETRSLRSLDLTSEQEFIVRTSFKFMMDAFCTKKYVKESEISEFVMLVTKLHSVYGVLIEQLIKDRDTRLRANHIVDVVYQLFLMSS